MSVNSEISAEMLLWYLYPDMPDKWKVKNLGTFYRNYNQDVISMKPDKGELILSRDGFLRYLPQGVVSSREELRSARDFAAAYEKMNYRRHLLQEAFGPLDTFEFRHRLAIEREVSDLLHDKIKLLLKEYYNVDVDTVKDPLVRKALHWLPHVSHLRGRLPFVKLLLSSLLECEVVMDASHRFSESESNRAWLPEVRYYAIIPGLTAEEYRDRLESLEPLKEFICNWFIPFDIHFELEIRPHRSEKYSPFDVVLDYNSDIQ